MEGTGYPPKAPDRDNTGNHIIQKTLTRSFQLPGSSRSHLHLDLLSHEQRNKPVDHLLQRTTQNSSLYLPYDMRPFPLLVSTAFLLVRETAADFPGNFSRSCTGVGLSHNFFLGASCSHPDNNGLNAQSANQFDLTMCIGLDQASGKMQWEV